MNAVQIPLLSIEDFLKAERSSQVRHEYAAGHIFAMAGASKRHNRIASNACASLKANAGECEVFFADVLLRIDQALYYPDVMAVCVPSIDPYLETNPCLIIEVLSDSTEAIDRREKLFNYQRITHLDAYLLVAQNDRRVDVYRRASGSGKGAAHWTLESYTASGLIPLTCPDMMLSLDVLYDGTDVPCLASNSFSK